MHAYYEIETEIPADHQLHLSLPSEIPAGKVKVAIIYEVITSPERKEASTAPENFLDFLGAGKAYSRFQSVEAVNLFIAEQREPWAIEQ